MFGSLLSCEHKAPKKSFTAKAGAAVARATILPLFTIGSRTALKNAEPLGGMVEDAAKKVGVSSLPVEGETLVKANAYAQMGLSASLALGIFPKVAAYGLVGSLVPTTVVGHAFWEKEDEGEKANEKLQFAKNMAVLGGLLYIATRD